MRQGFSAPFSLSENGERKTVAHIIHERKERLFPGGYTRATFFIFEPREGVDTWQCASAH